MNTQNCDNFDRCTQGLRTKGQPEEDNSLYSKHIYDNHVNNGRCYLSNPLDIVEGFGCKLGLSNDTFRQLLIYAIIAVVLYILYGMLFAQREVVEIDVATPDTVSSVNTPDVVKELVNNDTA